MYSAPDELAARRRLVEFFNYSAEAEVPELTRLARTIDRWSDEVPAYHRTGGASNGRVENMHMLVEKIRRTAHGFKNHDNYRRRLIGILGIKWDTVPTPRIQGRKPHSAAKSRESCNFFVTTIEFKPTLRRQRDDASDKGQIGRQKIFDGLLNRLDDAAS